MDVLFIQETRSWQVLFSFFFVFPGGGARKVLALKLLYAGQAQHEENFAYKELSVSTYTPSDHNHAPLPRTTRPQQPSYDQETVLAPVSALMRLAGSASFSSVAPRLLESLEMMSSPGNNVINTLSDNISALQDCFVDNFYQATQSVTVDLSQKVTLRLDASHRLFVAGDHPDKTLLNALLQQEPELSVIFAEIASQSAALRTIHNLYTMLRSAAPVSTLDNRVLPPAETSYQVSIKGEMNHFYFGQNS